MMIRILMISVALVVSVCAEAVVCFEKTVKYKETVGKQTIELSMHQGMYDFSKHKWTGGVEGDDAPARIDGVLLLGTDGARPVGGKNGIETIREIQVKWNGVVVKVPRRLHINLLDLTLVDDEEWKTIQFVPNDAGDALLVQATGGDGAGCYLVSLIIRKDGKHQQIYHDSWEDPLPKREVAWKYALGKE